MDLFTALQEGLIEGIEEKPERHVETVMSDVFIYKDVVRKIYKEREGIFVDMRDPISRQRFYRDDFNWNQSVSPDIHLSLFGVIKNNEGVYQLIKPEEAELWIIEMKRVEDTDTLFKRLNDGTATIKDVKGFVKVQTEALDKLTEQHLADHTDLLDMSLQTLWEIRLDIDLRAFGKSFGKEIPDEVTDKRVDTLLNYYRNHSFLQSLKSEDASILVDNHAGNVVFHDDRPQFIDIFLPKREWRVLDHHNNIARIAACVRTLGGNELADAMYETYAEHKELAPREVYDFEEAYNALIKGYYYTYLKQPEIAMKYFAFADKTLAGL